jgi:molecular chaperone DnaJ
LGAKIDVPTLDGEEELVIPPGTQPGDRFTIKGKGVPFIRSGRRGDQIVTAKVKIPTALNEEQRQLLEELAESMGEKDIGNGGKGLFDKFRDVFGNE